MITTIVISAITVLLMALTVLFKPYIKVGKVKLGLYWIVCLIGALTLIATGSISLTSVFNGITANTSVNPLKILTLFLAMTLISVYLGDAGFFDYVASRVFVKSKGGNIKLFIALYIIVSILTIFTSNDIIILTFTPPICIFCKKAGISPLPFLVGEFVAANTWSMMLIVGNPTNIYLAQSAGIGFFEYFSVMALPTLVGGLIGFFALLLVFRKSLFSPLKTETAPFDKTTITTSTAIQKKPLIFALIHLVLCIVMLAVSDFIGVEMWIICLILALSLTIFDLVYDLIAFHSISPVLRAIKKEPYELIPFVLSMFVIVLSLKECGFTDILSDLLITGQNTDGVSFGFLTALCSNLFNNIPSSVLMEKIISGGSSIAVYGAIIGSNIGAFITPVGALAGIMWNKILGKYKVKLPFKRFILYGSAVAIPTLIGATITLFLIF